MNGTNILILNELVIIQAVQEYLDRQTVCTGTYKVTSVNSDGDGTFRVISSKEAGEK